MKNLWGMKNILGIVVWGCFSPINVLTFEEAMKPKLERLEDLWRAFEEESCSFPRPSAESSDEVKYHDFVTALFSSLPNLPDELEELAELRNGLSPELRLQMLTHLTRSAFLSFFSVPPIDCIDLDSPYRPEPERTKAIIHWLYHYVCLNEANLDPVLAIAIFETKFLPKSELRDLWEIKNKQEFAEAVQQLPSDFVDLRNLVLLMEMLVCFMEGDSEKACEVRNMIHPVLQAGSVAACMPYLNSLPGLGGGNETKLQLVPQEIMKVLGLESESMLALVGLAATACGDFDFVNAIVRRLIILAGFKPPSFLEALLIEKIVCRNLKGEGIVANRSDDFFKSLANVITRQGFLNHMVESKNMRWCGTSLFAALFYHSYPPDKTAAVLRLVSGISDAQTASLIDKLCSATWKIYANGGCGPENEDIYIANLGQFRSIVKQFPVGSAVYIYALNSFIMGGGSLLGEARRNLPLCKIFGHAMLNILPVNSGDSFLKYLYMKWGFCVLIGSLAREGCPFKWAENMGVQAAAEIINPENRLDALATLSRLWGIKGRVPPGAVEELIEMADRVENYKSALPVAWALAKVLRTLTELGHPQASLVYEKVLSILDVLVENELVPTTGQFQSGMFAGIITILIEFNAVKGDARAVMAIIEKVMPNGNFRFNLSEVIKFEFICAGLAGVLDRRAVLSKEMLNVADFLMRHMRAIDAPSDRLAGVYASELQILEQRLQERRKSFNSRAQSVDHGHERSQKKIFRKKRKKTVDHCTKLNLQDVYEETETEEAEEIEDFSEKDLACYLGIVRDIPSVEGSEVQKKNSKASRNKRRNKSFTGSSCSSFASQKVGLQDYWNDNWRAVLGDVGINLSHIFDFHSETGLVFEGGFHHDPEGFVSLPSILEKDEIYWSSFRTGFGQNNFKESTFFPRNWTRYQVLDCIGRAYLSALKNARGVVRVPVQATNRSSSLMQHNEDGEVVYCNDKASSLRLAIVLGKKSNHIGYGKMIKTAYPVFQYNQRKAVQEGCSS